MTLEEEKYEYWLACIYGIAAHKKRMLREKYKNAAALYNIEETSVEREELMNEKEKNIFRESRRQWNLKEKYDMLAEQQICFVPFYSERYPRRLASLCGMPYALYVKGKLPPEDKTAAAIVGARSCSTYGEREALRFAENLARSDVCIISGMARGIDGAGHRGALNVHAPTWAVLGCGVDICYPREHRGLYEDILREGGILSEYPPGVQPLSTHFPARNRIISGLSDYVLVMEARERSGSLITADMALEQGKEVYALPGPVTSGLSRGCLGLIRQGAGVLLSPRELLEEMGLPWENDRDDIGKNQDKNKIMLERSEKLVYSKLGLYPKGRQEILEQCGLDAQAAVRALVSLELKGYIHEISKNYYVRHK